MAASSRSRIPFSKPLPNGPTPRMEAPIRQECPASTQRELRTPYQQQVQAPVLSTHSTGVRRGAILEMMRRKSQELEHQAAIPKQMGEAPEQDPQGLVCGRSWSRLRKGFEQRQSQSTPRPGGGAFAFTSGAPSAPPVQLGHFCPRHPADFREEGWKRMLIGHTCSTSLSPLMSPLRKLRPSPLL